ncbi:mucin-5AC [Biomphalaria pfeifferi]|uniref:Mucin-5AC n=1 Tax=Biomphalaria pfeifferi TaxID=112525 RepID=A0AAD8F7N9_BIOPF|nr:mucin-5AC [Biomphalaria pfeifferi]
MAEEDDRGMAFKVQVEELGPEVAELLESVNGEGVDREAVVVQIVQDVFVTENSRSEPDPASSCTEASRETDSPSLDELQQDTPESAKENNPAPTRYRPLVPKSQSLALKLAKMQLSKKVNSISARLAHADHPKRNPESKFYRPTFRSRRLPEPIPLPSRDSSTASSSADADKEQDPAATSREKASAPTSREEASAPTSKEAPAATSREQVSAPTSTNTGNSNLNRTGSDASGSTSRNPWTSISSVPGPSVATNSDGKASEAPAPAGPPADSVPGTSVSPSSDIDASDDPRSQSVITFFPRPGLPDFVTSPSASNRQRDLSPLKVPRTTHARPIGTERTACPLPFFPTLGVPETIPSQPTMTTDTSNVSATWPSVIPCQENVPVNPASVTSGPTHQAPLSSSDNAVSRAVDHPDRQTIDSGQGYYEPPFYEITNTTYSIPAVGSDQSHVTTNPTLVTSGPMHQASLISSDYAVPRALDHPDRQSNESGQDYYVTQFYDNRDRAQSMAAVDFDQRHVTTYPTLVTSGPMHQASMISSDYAVPRALDHPDRQSIESGQGYFVPPFYDNRDSTHSMAAVDSDQRHVTTNPLVISGLRQQELLSSSDISDPRVQVHPDGQSGQAGYLPSFYDNIDHSTPVVSSDQIENIPRNTSLVIYEPRQAQRNVLLAQYSPGAEVNPNWQPGNNQEYIPVSPYHSGYTTTMPTVGTGQYAPTNVPYAIPIRPMVSQFHHFPRPQFIWPTVDPSQQRSVALMPSVNPANIQHVSHVWPANASGQIVMVPTGSSSVISDPSHAPTSFSSPPPVQVTANTSAETPHEVYPMMPSPTSSSSSEQSQASMASVSGADSTPTLRWNRMSLDFENRITRIRGPFPHYPYETLPEIIQRINSRGLDASSEEIAEMQTATFIDDEMFKSMLSGNPTAIGYYQRSYQAMEIPTSGIFDYPDRPPLRFCNNEAVIDISKALPEFFISDRNEQRARTRRQTSSAGRNQASRQAYGSSRQVRPRSLRHSRSNTQPTLHSSAEARIESEEANPESMQDARERHVQTTVGPEPEAAALERMQLLQCLSARNKETHTQRQTKNKYQSSQTRRAASRQTVTESSVGAQNKRHEKTWTSRYQNKANTGSSARTGRSGKTTKTSSQTAGSSAQTAGSSAQTAGSSAQTAGSSAQTAGSSAQTAGSSAQTAGSSAQTAGSSAETSGSAAETSGSAGQTSGSAGQTSERAGQTSGSSAQTSGSSALTDESSAPTAGSSAPTTGNSAPTTGNSAQRTGSAAPTTGSAAPTTGSAAPTTGSSAQTSRNTAQASGSAAQTSRSTAQISERAAQTSGSSAQTSGSSAQTSGSAAQTSGSAAQTSERAGQTSERADQTIGNSAQTAGSSAPTTGNSAPTTGNSAPTTGNSAPTTGNSAPMTGNSAQRTGSAAPTTGSAAPTTGSSVQTSRSTAQTNGSAAQTSERAGQTSERAGQTSERADQTLGSSDLTDESSAQTAGSSAPTAGSSAPTAGSSAPTAGSSAPTAGSSAPTAGSSAPTTGNSAPTTGNSAQRTGSAAPTTGSSVQTSRSAAQTSGSAGQTSERAGQTSERAGQTSERAGKTSGKAGKTSGKAGKTSGKAGKTSGKAGKTSGRTGKTSGSTAQTENLNPAETEQPPSPALNLRNSMDPSEAIIGITEMGIIVTRSGHLYHSALASNPQRVTPALASNPQRVTSALSSSSSEFTASASWRARGQSQKLGSTSRQGHTRHRHRHDEVGRSSTDLETSDEERPESPTMDEAFSQAYTESRDAASEIIDEFNNIFDPIFCWFERRSPFPCNRSRERSQTAEPAVVEARSPESEQAFLKNYLMQVVRAIQHPPMTCQLSNFQTTELMEIRLRLFARRAQLRAARASVRFDSLGLHRLAETFRTFADPLVAPITGLDSRVYVWQCQCGGQHEVPQPSPEQETEYCDIIVEFLNYESVITEAIIYVEREIMHRGLTQPITVTTNELGFSSRARGYVEVEWRRIFRNIGIEIGNRREAMMIRLVQPIARLNEYQRIFRSRGMAPPGLTNSELSQIPVVQQADASSQCESTSASECSICLKSYRPRDEVRVLPCGHRFHRKCIDTWLKKTCSCPMCRKSTRDPNPE